MSIATSSRPFSGARLRLARLFNGLSQAELGERSGVTHAFVSQTENELKQPSEAVIASFADALGCLPDFFLRPAPIDLRDDECHFRKRKTTLVGVKTRVLAAGTLFGELVEMIEKAVKLPAYEIPTIRVLGAESIERAAESCRRQWDLGLDTPLKNIVRAAERAGIVVGRFALDAAKVDAFSWVASRGIIILNSEKGSTSRSRFDVAHEWGHLVMHAGLHAGDEHHESEADRFASAFLLPRAGFLREFPRFSGRLRLEALLPMKARWRTSLAALVRRAHDLGVITPEQYEQAFRQYYSRGFHKGEPGEPSYESPETVNLAFGVLRDYYNQTFPDVARSLGWSVDRYARVVPDVAAAAAPPPPRQPPLITLAQYRAKKGLD